jgi:hypothetical protein
MIFPKYFDSKYTAAFRQNTLFSFTRMVDLLWQKGLFTGYECMSILEEALIQKALYVLKLAQQYEDTVDMSIYSL